MKVLFGEKKILKALQSKTNLDIEDSVWKER